MPHDRDDPPCPECGERPALSRDNAYSEQRLAERVAKAETERDLLRDTLKQALRQWAMYAEMVERVDDFNLETEKSPEGEMYRAARALVS